MRKLSVGSILHLAIGCGGLLFFLGYDLIQGQNIEFGLKQFAGLAISTIILLAWGVEMLPWEKRPLYGALFILYLGGSLFMGLYPKPLSPNDSNAVLALDGFNLQDAVVNVLGFVPIGFLAMALLIAMRRQRQPLLFVASVTACFFISLVIELVQYGIPGRTSSLNDLAANTIGAAGGAGLYYFEHWFSHRRTLPQNTLIFPR